jgi:hypothetical protein
VHADGSAITFGEACALMGMLGCTILIPGPPGLLGVFQAGIYAGMTMYFPTQVVTGAGSAYVFLMYVIQLVWTVFAAGIFLVGDRKALSKLSHTPGLGDEAMPASITGEGTGEMLGSEPPPPSLDQRTATNG